MTENAGKKTQRQRETQAEYMNRITDSLNGLRLGTGSTGRGSHAAPPATLLMNAMIYLEIVNGQNRGLAAFLEHCNSSGPGDVSLFAIEDFPCIELGSEPGSMLLGLKEVVEENRRLREVLGERIIRKVV